MGKRQRRQSQNSRYMREILDRLREFDVDEVRLLCDKWRARHAGRQIAPGRRGKRSAPEPDLSDSA